MWHVYFLQSVGKNWYYVGSTNRLSERVAEHNTGRVISTKGHLPVNLVYTEQYSSEKEARAREREIKRKRKLKEEIIRLFEEK